MPCNLKISLISEILKIIQLSVALLVLSYFNSTSPLTSNCCLNSHTYPKRLRIIDKLYDSVIICDMILYIKLIAGFHQHKLAAVK